MSNSEAKSCPKCGGTSGFQWKEYHTMIYAGSWDGDFEHVDTIGQKVNKTVVCNDCDKRIKNPILNTNTNG